MSKKQLAILLTLLIGLALLALLFYIYSKPVAVVGSKAPTEKLKDFFSSEVQSGSSFFGK